METRSHSDRSPRVSARAQRFWDRLVDWYGVRFSDQFGEHPPEDWRRLVDAASNDAVAEVLAEIRSKHVTHPPTFPEVDALFTRAGRPPVASLGPTVQERLADWVVRNRTLTRNQLRMPWSWIGSGDARNRGPGKSDPNFQIVGVIVPADGEHPGYRVMVEDMQLEGAP